MKGKFREGELLKWILMNRNKNNGGRKERMEQRLDDRQAIEN